MIVLAYKHPPSASIRAVVGGLFASTGLIALQGCHGSQAALDTAARESANIGSIFDWMFWITVPVFFAVVAFLVTAITRNANSSQVPDATIVANGTSRDRTLQRVLIGWIVVITLCLVALTVRSYFVDRALAQPPEQAPVKIEITGWQWWWQVKYVDDADPSKEVETANELHLPVGRPAEITLASHDVIHSLWIPNLAGKKDLIPGRINQLTVTPTRIGTFRGQCAEFCGLQHAHMALDVQVESADDFGRWIEHLQQDAPSPTTELTRAGHDYFVQRECALCHRIAGTEASGRNGPDLTHVAGRHFIAAGVLPNEPPDMAAWLASPQHVKPHNNMPDIGMSGEEIQALTAYLETLQ